MTVTRQHRQQNQQQQQHLYLQSRNVRTGRNTEQQFTEHVIIPSQTQPSVRPTVLMYTTLLQRLGDRIRQSSSAAALLRFAPEQQSHCVRSSTGHRHTCCGGASQPNNRPPVSNITDSTQPHRSWKLVDTNESTEQWLCLHCRPEANSMLSSLIGQLVNCYTKRYW